MSCFGLDLNGKTLKKLAIVFVALVLVGYGLSAMTPLSIVTPGWEIYNSIGGVKSGSTVYTKNWQIANAYEIGNAYWKFDVDSPNYGVPTVSVQTTDIRHVDFTGQLTPNTSPAQTRTVTRDNHTYILDYHIYMFDVTIRTMADRVAVTSWGWTPSTVWEHETSWAYQSSGIGGLTPASRGQTGSVFNGGAYVKFVINPWKGISSYAAPEDYVIQNAWSGVMNSYVVTKAQGQVKNNYPPNQYNTNDGLPPEDAAAPKSVSGGLETGQINMYEDLGGFNTQAPVTNWDTEASPDSRIPSTVVLSLPVNLQVGAYLHRDALQTVDQLYPCDVYVMYTVRVDVLQTHDFVLETAYNPPTGAPPTDWYSWALGFWDGIINSLSDPFGQLWVFFILIVIVMVLITVLNPGVWVNMTRLMRGRRGGGD